MPFSNTPEDVPTGTYDEASVSEETVEVWVETEVGEDDEERAFGVIAIREDEVPYNVKSAKVLQAAESSGAVGFDYVEYYVSMLEYQIQETSFGADDRLRTWLKTEANETVVEEFEDRLVPPPLGSGTDEADEAVAEGVREVMEAYVEEEGGEWTDSLEQFAAWLSREVENEDDRTGN
jgi:hypothetical protein